MSSAPSFIATPRTPAVAFVNADGTTFKTVFSAGINGSRVDSLFGASTDTAGFYVMQLAVQKSGVDYPIGEVTIPIGAGTNGAAKSVALLNPTDIPGLTYTESGALYLETGCALRARVKSAVGGSFSIALVGVAGDY
ncbi:hypothetical protein RD110_08130 [Rhodoferax koreense]|uniref:Uncharacterized protein n=1 Tax=Rhodoferax koreensis TaxID=1842727 RepID=A0A1P8JU02_9BURK|nr:hypothetical protein [Rhodoferax koreense]APW37171.1 hypothetical protein RD110_08130 [Rhodoferax koreense]